MANAYIISDYSNWLTGLIHKLEFDNSQILDYEEMYED